MSNPPLQGLTVLDLTRLLPGAFATQILADLGAEVWKIEDTEQGDYMRYAPPFFGEWSAFFFVYNRGKKSVAINLKSEKGVSILKKWASQADMLIESFRPGVMEKLKVGYDQLKEVAPHLIYCAITGYGQEGPYRDRAGHDINYLSLSGALSIHGIPERPVLSPFQLADCAGGGMFAVIGILAALHQREKTGKGSFVDTAMFEGVAYWMNPYYAMASLGFELKREKLSLSGALPNYRIYETKDGNFLSVGALEPKFLESLSQALGKPLPPISLFDLSASGHEELEALFKEKTLQEWIEIFQSFDACVEPVREVKEALQDPHLRQQGLLSSFELNHQKIFYVGSPIRLNKQLFHALPPPPKKGAQTVEALKKLGFSEPEIQELKKEAVVSF